MMILPDNWLIGRAEKDVFKNIFSLDGKVYRQQKNRKTLRFEKNGESYFVKLHNGTGWREIFKNIFQLRLPVVSAKNEWLAIKRLSGISIQTTPLVGYGKVGINPANRKSFLITKEIKNVESLETFAPRVNTFKLKRNIIKNVAHITRKLHENGINHRDLYLCHFLIDLENINKDSVELHLIDLHRAQIRHRVPKRWLVKDLAGLHFSSMDLRLTKNDLYYFMKEYRNESLRVIFTNDKRLWQNIIERADRTYAAHSMKNNT